LFPDAVRTSDMKRVCGHTLTRFRHRRALIE
jgi:hypothetical protein